MAHTFDAITRRSVVLPNPLHYIKKGVNKVRHYKISIELNMLWIKRDCPIEREIVDFGKSRRHYTTTQNHLYYLRTFIKVTGIREYEQLQESDIESYLHSINTSVVRESERIGIAQALFLFLRFKKLKTIRGQEKRGRGRPEKEQRNFEIFVLRQKKYTYDEIARQHRLNKSTVYEIIKRLENKAQ